LSDALIHAPAVGSVKRVTNPPPRRESTPSPFVAADPNGVAADVPRSVSDDVPRIAGAADAPTAANEQERS